MADIRIGVDFHDCSGRILDSKDSRTRFPTTLWLLVLLVGRNA